MFPVVLRGWRSWKSAKGVALLAIGALALGIGSTTAIYTVVQAVLLKPLSYPAADRFVALFSARTNEPNLRGGSSNVDLAEYQQHTRSFDVFGWYRPRNFNLTWSGNAEIAQGVEVTPSLVDNIGVAPVRGRWFPDVSSGHENFHVVVISHRLWKHLGSDPDAVGHSLQLDNQPFTIIGVMPPGFLFPAGENREVNAPGELWVPLHEKPEVGESSYFCYARLKEGVSLEQATQDVKRVADQIARERPTYHVAYTAKLFSLRDLVVLDIRPTLLLLLAAAGVLLLITCANVAGLLLARSVSRARETAIRVALGASRGQLALEYFVEGLLLSLCASVLGILVSTTMVKVVIAQAAEHIPRVDEITTNIPVLMVALGLALVASIFFSMAPLWQAIRTRPNEVLTEGVRASAGARTKRLSRGLVITEVALAFTLLTVGALLLFQLGSLRRVVPGFDPRNVLAFRLNASETLYSDLPRLVAYQKSLLDAVRQIPGVTDAGIVNQLPLNGCCISTTLVAEGIPTDPRKQERVSFMAVSPSYFTTMHIPLRSGRFFEERDGNGDVKIIINEAAARRYWPGRNPLGAYARMSSDQTDRFQVVGVVGDVKNNGLGEATVPEMYFPTLKANLNQMYFVVRSSMPAESMTNAVRRAIARVNPAQPIYEVQTMESLIKSSLGRQQLQSWMISFFAVAALLLAALGVYGVMAYSVRQRTVEIGTRMAVGATSGDLFRSIVGDGLRLAGYGIGIGAFGAIGVALLLRAKLFGVQVNDPLPFVLAVLVVTFFAALACAFPGWRAMQLSPMSAIRNEAETLFSNARREMENVADQLAEWKAGRDEQTESSEAELLAQIADSGRRATSFSEALRNALETVRERLHAESLALFAQKSNGLPYRCTAVLPDACGEWSLPADAAIVSRLRSFSGVIPLLATDLDSLERWATETSPERLGEVATLRETGAELAVGVAVKSDVSALLLVGRSTRGRNYNARERRLLRGVAAQLAMLIENGRLTDRIVEQERLRRELLLASEVQKRLFPEHAPETTQLELTGVCIPARGVGGDYYDFLDLGNQHVGIALADVAGKGIAAALVMSVVQASLRSLAGAAGVSLADLASRMNRLLHRSTRSNSYATFFYAEMNEQTGRLRYVNAGHNPPFLLRKTEGAVHTPVPFVASSAPIEELSVGGTIIGMFAQSSYEEGMLDLHKGDVLIVFTDGVPEALDPRDEEFGEDRLKELLRSVAHLSVNEMAAQILGRLKQWIADAEQYDDLTFVLMKVI